MATGVLYMIPVEISSGPSGRVLPQSVKEVVEPLLYFAVENVRSARRFIKRLLPQKNIDELTFFNIGKHSPFKEDGNYSPIMAPLLRGESVGVLSEAGCPGIADPGAVVASFAQKKGIRVVPLVGPSSILLSLMASGLNGQSFAFKGYLPKEAGELRRQVQTMEQAVRCEGQTQIFIETPFRTEKLFADLLRLCHSDTLLCVAQDITGDQELIVTRSIAYFRQHPPKWNRVPTIFLLGR
ncbi:MAG: SAM-dependent methyltransferase [Porphyromonas sp.]|nr:SAM-dependent methyltransferase [Porphyromonas sp.]